ncbi:UNVERIFIED_CONTAM: hypothetical protein FKN15_047140 [Acipenser sinensis]
MKYGLERILGEEKSLSLLARAIEPRQPNMMTDVVKLLSAVCIVGEENTFEKVLEAITTAAEHRNIGRFHPIVEGLRDHSVQLQMLNAFQVLCEITADLIFTTMYPKYPPLSRTFQSRVPSGSSSKSIPRGVQDAPYSLEIAGSNPGYVTADHDRGFLGGGAQLAERLPGREGLGQQGNAQFTAHQRPLWPIGHLRFCSGTIRSVLFSGTVDLVASLWIRTAKNDGLANNNWAFQIGEKTGVACMQLINALVTSPDDLDFRLHIRNEFMRCGLKAILPHLNIIKSDALDIQLKVFEEHKEEDMIEFSHRLEDIRCELEYPFKQPQYFKIIEECVSQILLHRSGTDPDFTYRKRLDVDFSHLIDVCVDKARTEEYEQRVSELEQKAMEQCQLEFRLFDHFKEVFLSVFNSSPPPPTPPLPGCGPPPPPPFGAPPPPPLGFGGANFSPPPKTLPFGMRPKKEFKPEISMKRLNWSKVYK